MLTSPALSVVINNLGPKLLVRDEVQLGISHVGKLDLEAFGGEMKFEEAVEFQREYFDREVSQRDLITTAQDLEDPVFDKTGEYRIYLENRIRVAAT